MNEFEQSLFTLLYYIPMGKLTTYGHLSQAAGYPNHSRHVGKVLSRLPKETKLPWYRVVNAQGKISLIGEAFQRQKSLLENEGISVSSEGKIQKFRALLIE